MKAKKILIVEDEVLIAEHLAKILQNQGYQDLTLVHRYAKALDILKKDDFDLALLDINLEKDTEGVSLAKLIESKYHFPYLFITAQTDPLVLGMAVKLSPSAFITKPFNKVDVAMAVEIALREEEEEQRYLIFKDGWTTVKVPYDEIFWAEADGNYIHLHCASRVYTLRNSLTWLETSLDSDRFLKVHRSRLIRVDLVEKLENDQVYVKGEALGISRSGYKRLQELL